MAKIMMQADSAVMDLADDRIRKVFVDADVEPDQLRSETEVLRLLKLRLLKDRFEEGMLTMDGAIPKAGEHPSVVAGSFLLMLIEAKLKLAEVLIRRKKLIACMAKTRTDFEGWPGLSKEIRLDLEREAKTMVSRAEDNAAEEQVHLSKVILAKVGLTEMLTSNDSFAGLYSMEMQKVKQGVEKSGKTEIAERVEQEKQCEKMMMVERIQEMVANEEDQMETELPRFHIEIPDDRRNKKQEEMTFKQDMKRLEAVRRGRQQWKLRREEERAIRAERLEKKPDRARLLREKLEKKNGSPKKGRSKAQRRKEVEKARELKK